MFHFLSPTKSEAETVKIGLCINFKAINRFRSDIGIVEIDAMCVDLYVMGQFKNRLQQ